MKGEEGREKGTEGIGRKSKGEREMNRKASLKEEQIRYRKR